MDNKISVIIPIYNVEQYLYQCLDSVINQTYRNLEILLIDDGSPDQCGAICDEYAKRDSRIKVTHKQNAGLSAAWNDGIAKATGDWIAFVDSDDWIDDDYFESIIKENHGREADLIQTSGYYHEENNQQYVWYSFLNPFVFNNGTGREFMIVHSLFRPKDHKTKATVSNVWGKLYKRSFLQENGFQFDEKIRAGLINDVIFNVEVYMRASIVVGISYYGYHYRVSAGSGTFKFDSRRPVKEIYVNQQLEKVISQPDVPENLKKAYESYCLRDIVHNLERCYFHPDNTLGNREIAKGIREMKQMPYGKMAIASRNNPYNGLGLKVFQMALRLPYLWPLKIMVAAWHYWGSR